MDPHDVRVFLRVAELASFTQAAEQLDMAKGRVSTAVQRLEAKLGARLLQRSTRRVTLTPDGEQFQQAGQQWLADAEQLQAMFAPVASGLRGRVRIDMPHTLARDVVVPQLPTFMAAHPALDIGISTSDRRVDLVGEGFDAVIRVGTLKDAELIARPLGWMAMRNVASPAYLKAHGTPKSLQDLSKHRIVHYAEKLGVQGAGWDWFDGTKHHVVPMPCSLVVNGTDAYQAACLAGIGLIQAPVLGTQALVNVGRLVDVLPSHTAAPMPVSLLYANRRHLAPRVVAVLNWLAEVVTPHLREPGVKPADAQPKRRRGGLEGKR
jgi:DNA-binding transcriptional LysR family regulator